MRKKKKTVEVDVFATSMPELVRLGASEVAEILDMDSWRLQKFLSSESYGLSAKGKMGEGKQGSRRLFGHEEICRIGIANALLKDGFSSKLVSFVLHEIEDRELLEIDQEGNVEALVITFTRGAKGPILGLNNQGKADQPPYYTLDTRRMFAHIEKRMSEILKQRRG